MKKDFISTTSEEYLKVIYVLQKQNGLVRVTDIANKIGCSKPNVTKQLNILKNSKMIKYESYGKIELTTDGLEQAKRVLIASDIIYLLLCNIIGIDNEIAKNESIKIKGVISDDTLKNITNYVYKELDIEKMNCNFNINNEKCRECIMKKGSNNDRVN